jgi:hypothetical protein
MVFHLALAGFDLLIQRGQHRDQGTGVRRSGDAGLTHVRGTQHGLDPLRLRSDVRRRARPRAALIRAVVSLAAIAGSGAWASSSRLPSR